MTVFERVRMPSLGGATGWLNSEPLGPAELRGHVILVDFWTLTCINWLRQEPYVRAGCRWLALPPVERRGLFIPVHPTSLRPFSRKV
jgi:hypothetical protein